MSEFLDYLDGFEAKINNTIISEKKVIVSPSLKCPSCNSTKVKKIEESDFTKEHSICSDCKKRFITEKKVVKPVVKKEIKKVVPKNEPKKNPLKEATDHATDILDGLADSGINLNTEMHNELFSEGQTQTVSKNEEDLNMDSTSDHASALL